MSDGDAAQGSRRHARRRLMVVGAFAAAVVAFFALGGHRWLDLATLREQRDALRAFAEAHRAAAVALGFAIYAAVVALSLPGATLLSLVAGFVFGRWVGTALVVAAATLGATVVFLAARYVAGGWARRRLGRAFERVADGFARDAFGYLLFLRLVPLFPFFLVNLAPALTRVPARTYVLATLIGIVPGTFVYVNLGEALGSVDSMRGLVSAQTLLALALLGGLALASVWWRRNRAR